MKALKKKLRASAMTFGGVDWDKLFKQYDRDNSGDLDFEEFRKAVRKSAKISANDVTDKELNKIFCSVDDDQVRRFLLSCVYACWFAPALPPALLLSFRSSSFQSHAPTAAAALR